MARLRRLNPAAEISRIDAPDFDIGKLLRAEGLDPADAKADARAWLNAAAYEQQEHHDHDHQHDHDDYDHHHLHYRDIASFCFVRETPISREALRLLLDALQQISGEDFLRVKGIVNVAEQPVRPAVIQGASTFCIICRGSNAGRMRTTAARSSLSRKASIGPRSRI